MLGILARLLPWAVLFFVWISINRSLDKIDAERARAKAHPFWQKIYWMWGWTLGPRSKFVVVRYLVSGAVLILILRWIALAISTPVP